MIFELEFLFLGMRKFSLFTISMWMLLTCCQHESNYNSANQIVPKEFDAPDFSVQEVALEEDHVYQYLFLDRHIDRATLYKNDYKVLKQVIQRASEEGEFKFLRDESLSSIFNMYCFQYVPFINENGEKEVYVNAFCHFPGEERANSLDIPEVFDWHVYLINIMDGGSCYWSMKINLDTKIYYDFSVNGHA